MEEFRQIVRIAGYCATGKSGETCAGYGIDWAGRSRNKSESLAEPKTQLRAEITALIALLEIAATDSIPVTVQHQSEELSNTLEEFRCASIEERRSIENSDLLTVYARLRVIVQPKIIRVSQNENNSFHTAFVLALKAAALQQTRATRPTPTMTNDTDTGRPVVVDIFGCCNDGSNNAKAGYGVFWGVGNQLNTSANIPGQQTSYLAEFHAVNAVLDSALSNKIEKLTIRSRSVSVDRVVKQIVSRGAPVFLPKNQTNRELILAIARKLQNFEKVEHCLVSKNAEVQGQKEAELLARRCSGLGETTTTIAICGVVDADNRIARFASYWGVSDERNEVGWFAGKHDTLCVEVHALRTVMETAIAQGITSIRVSTTSKRLGDYVNTIRPSLQGPEWPIFAGKVTKCGKMFREVNSLLSQITVRIVESMKNSDMPLRMVSLSNRIEQVRTFGMLILGNNENMAKYAVFWGPGHSRNTVGTVERHQSAVRAKEEAMRIALTQAIDQNIEKLAIFSDYSKNDGIDEVLANEIKNLTQKIQHVVFKHWEPTAEQYENLAK